MPIGRCITKISALREIAERRKTMETPEIEFLLYLLNRYIKNNSLDASQATVAELLENINMNLTPIGGG
jgi:hypothetical protein